MVLYVLFEHASGYAIFKVIANEEIGALLPEVQEAVHDLERFGKVVKLVAFSPFKSASHALENVNSISEGVVHEDLKVFIENNVPTGKKKSKVLLGISDSKLGASIQENVSICCESSGVVLEIIRGIRQHFHKMIEGLTAVGAGKAQLGLGHSYSRAKVKFNVHRADNMIIQTIALLDQLDKDINTFSMRIREWFSYHFPELIKIVSDNYMYAKVAKYIKSRKELTEDRLPGLEEIVMDEAKAKGIYDASKMSMGMDISPIDLVNIQTFADRVIDMADYRKKLHQYLLSKMDQVAPNLSAVIGELVGARLISHAGSLTNLAKYPASTVQILGAEKALFRALKTRGKTPKYGLIFHSSFIGRAGTKNKGRISRYLANKCSIASRIDCFSETPSPLFGKKLHEQVEDRLKFYETGETPKKNIDVMKEAMEELMKLDQSQTQEPEKKKKKKKKKKIKEEKENVDRNMIENGFDESLVNVEVKDEEEAEVSKRKKKAKKRKTEDAESSVVETTMLETTIEEVEEQPKKKAKKKKKTEGEISIFASSGLDTTVEAEEVPKKKKKKKDKKHEE